MTYTLALAAIISWTIAPNAALAIVTGFRASEEQHLVLGATAFIPWTILGLSLAQ